MTAVIPGEHIWLSDAEQGFLPCLVTEAIKPGDAGKSVDVMLPDGRTQRRETSSPRSRRRSRRAGAP